MAPRTRLDVATPPELKGQAIAAAEWKRIITLQDETKAAQDGSPIITAFDKTALVRYCMIEQYIFDLQALKKETFDEFKALGAQIKKIRPTAENFKERNVLMDQRVGTRAAYQSILSQIGVLGTKQHDLAKSLYLTPRARAGVMPEGAGEQEEGDELDKMLDE